MNIVSALKVSQYLLDRLAPLCEEGKCIVGGGVRRGKADVHDLEILAKPILRVPRPTFGDPRIYPTLFHAALGQLADEGMIKELARGERKKVFRVNLREFEIDHLGPFSVEFYITLPPAQWGVQCVIRTGPGTDDDNFSQWVVTNQSRRGALPDGYKVRDLAVWKDEQLSRKGEPLKGESPLPMDEEKDFLDFLGLGWIDPKDRHANWRKT